MTAPHNAVVSRLSANFAAMSEQFAKVSADLTELDRLLAQRPTPAPQPAPHPVPPPMPFRSRTCRPPRRTRHHLRRPWPAAAIAPPPPPERPGRRATANWIGKVLAVAGVAVTLIGVVLLLVLAAQAGILRPEIRVGAGAVLAGALVAVAARLNSPPRRTGRCHRPRRNGYRRGVHGRHRDHDDLRLGVRTRRAGARRGDRRRWPHPGQALGLPAPRPARAGAADRPRPDRRRRHHDAVDRVHARHLGRVAARSARQGLDLAACGADHGADVSAVDRIGRGPCRRHQRRLAGRRLRDRRRARHGGRTGAAAVDR